MTPETIQALTVSYTDAHMVNDYSMQYDRALGVAFLSCLALIVGYQALAHTLDYALSKFPGKG